MEEAHGAPGGPFDGKLVADCSGRHENDVSPYIRLVLSIVSGAEYQKPYEGVKLLLRERTTKRLEKGWGFLNFRFGVQTRVYGTSPEELRRVRM